MAANPELQQQVDALKHFLSSAPENWEPNQIIRRFLLPNGEYISCVLWKNLFHLTGTDIMRALTFRFQAFGRPIKNLKKFEEGVFSDLRNLKAGIDASLEEPRSEFLELLYKHSCIRTQKKQKVFYWFSVPHDRLFTDALERDLKREALGQEPTTVAVSAEEASVGLLPSSLVSSAHRTSTNESSQMSPYQHHRTPSQLSLHNEPQIIAPVVNMTGFAGMSLGIQQPVEQSLLPLFPTMESMDDWIAEDAPLAPSMASSNPAPGNVPRSTSWDDGFLFNTAPALNTTALGHGNALETTPNSFSSTNTNDRERTSSNSSSLSSLMHLDQGYGSFDDTSTLLLQQVTAASKPDYLFDLLPSVTRASPEKSVGGGGHHTRAHSFSHNLASAAAAAPSPMNPLFGMYSMFDGSPNYKRRRSSELSDGGPGHRRSVSSASTTFPSELFNFGAAPNVPGIDGETRVERRTFNCSFDGCGRNFKRYEHLKRHHRTHTKERPYVCIYQGCDKSFSRSDNLAQHIRVHQKFPNGTITTTNNTNNTSTTNSPAIESGGSDCSSESGSCSMPSTPTTTTTTTTIDPLNVTTSFPYEESPLPSPQLLEGFDHLAEHDPKHMDYLFDSAFGLGAPMGEREISFFGA